MHTFALQALIYYQTKSEDDLRFENFLIEMKKLAAEHDIEFADYESFGLREEDFAIAPCNSCGHLTIDKDDIDEDTKAMVSEFWYYARTGIVDGRGTKCDYCKVRESAT